MFFPARLHERRYLARDARDVSRAGNPDHALWALSLCAENERCAPRTKLFPHAQERPQKLTTLPSADGFGRHKPIETSTQASTRSFTGGRPCDGTLQMLRRGMNDLCRDKRSCGGEGGKCSLAFLVTRGISWRGRPKNLKHLHVVRCYPLRCRRHDCELYGQRTAA